MLGERVDPSVAPAPHDAFAVILIAVGVGIASGVQPADGHAFAEPRRSEQSINYLLVGLGASVPQEGIHLRRRWWQPGQVERRTADQGSLLGREARSQAFSLQPGQ